MSIGRRRSARHPRDESDESPARRRPRRAASSANTSLANSDGIDQEDDEYQEDVADDDEDDEEVEEEEVEAEIEDLADDDDDDEDDDEDDVDNKGKSKKRSRSKSVDAVDKRQKVDEDDEIGDEEKEVVNELKLEIVNDEYELPANEKGDEKVNTDGELQGGREYRVKAFTIHGKDSRLFMLSTEVARTMGFRDSYLFFQKHANLYKYIASDKQKVDLVERGIMPLSYKSRVIGLITARSGFREFGAKIIVNGRHIADDYYEEKAKLEEPDLKEGDLVTPPAEYQPGGTTVGNSDNSGVQTPPASTASNGSGSVTATTPSSTSGTASNTAAAAAAAHAQRSREDAAIEMRKYLKVAPDNWIYTSATSSIHLNHLYYTTRPKSIKDKYTNIRFVPQHTQPTSAKLEKLQASPNRLEFTKIMAGDLKARKLGLADLDDDVFMDCVDDEVKEAIIRQRDLERSL